MVLGGRNVLLRNVLLGGVLLGGGLHVWIVGGRGGGIGLGGRCVGVPFRSTGSWGRSGLRVVRGGGCCCTAIGALLFVVFLLKAA